MLLYKKLFAQSLSSHFSLNELSLRIQIIIKEEVIASNENSKYNKIFQYNYEQDCFVPKLLSVNNCYIKEEGKNLEHIKRASQLKSTSRVYESNVTKKMMKKKLTRKNVGLNNEAPVSFNNFDLEQSEEKQRELKERKESKVLKRN